MDLKKAVATSIGWAASAVIIPVLVLALGWLKFYDWVEDKVRPNRKRKYTQ